MSIHDQNKNVASIFAPKTVVSIDSDNDEGFDDEDHQYPTKISKTFTEESILSYDDNEDDEYHYNADHNNDEDERSSLLLPQKNPPVPDGMETSMMVLPKVQLHPLETRHTTTARSPSSPFVQESLIQRDPKRKDRYIMALQTSSDNGTALPLYCGEKSKHRVQNEPCYIFQSVVKDNYDPDDDKEEEQTAGSTEEDAETRATAIKNNKTKKKKRRTLWGTVVRKPGMEKTGDTYAVTYDVVYHVDRTRQTNYVRTGLLTGPDRVVATIVYEYVPKVQYWREGGRPRYAQFHIVGRDALDTKEPNRNAQGQRVLDFYGRGSSRSAKNIQLVNNNQHTTNNNKNHLVLQLVKCGTNLYHLDFSAPIEAFHAMAFALAQFDFKTR